MAFHWTNKGLWAVLKGDVNLTSDTIKVMLLNAEGLISKDVNFVSDIVADEFSGSGYTGGFGGAGRKTLASKTFTEDDTGDRAYFDAADTTWSTINGDDVKAVAIIKEITNDSASIVLGFVDTDDITANGSDILIAWAATGLLGLNA